MTLRVRQHRRPARVTISKHGVPSVVGVGDLLAGYAPAAAFDELFVAPEHPRRHALALHDALQTLSPADFADRCSARDRAFRDQGITFQLSGEERPFPLDLVPRIIPSDEWHVIEQGVRQRVL